MWTYTPEHHKTEYRGKDRVIFVGPRAQDILRPYLLRASNAYLFKACVHLPGSTPSPCWLAPKEGDPPPCDIVPCLSTLLHLPTMRHIKATPRFFAVNALDFDPDPGSPEPVAWYQFLHQLFDDDVESPTNRPAASGSASGTKCSRNSTRVATNAFDVS